MTPLSQLRRVHAWLRAVLTLAINQQKTSAAGKRREVLQADGVD